jgi:hypothetical protein
MAASGPQRNRNENKRTHCIVVDQDSLKGDREFRLNLKPVGHAMIHHCLSTKLLIFSY